jgi:predicted nucleic acid-binding protein
MTGLVPIFVDTVFWIALLDRRDALHARAVKWRGFLKAKSCPIVTTEAVFWEWLNASGAPPLRVRAVQSYRYCHADPLITVVDFEKGWVDGAVRLYEARRDKEWSLTDCLSFGVMERRGLRQALTTDHHFGQAGFEPLMLDDPPET